MAGEDKTRKISFGVRDIGDISNAPKLREEIEKALKEPYDVEISSWYLSGPRREGDEPRTTYASRAATELSRT